MATSAPSRAEMEDAFRRLPPETQQAIMNGTFNGTASVPYRRLPQNVSAGRRETSLFDVAKPAAKYYGQQYLNSGAATAGAGVAGGATGTGAGLAGAGAVGESGAAAGAAGQAASGGTPGFSIGTPSYAGYIAAAGDAYAGYKNLKDKNISATDKATRQQQLAALAVADVYTGGLAGLAEGYARGQWGGTMRKLDKLDQRTNPGTWAIAKVLGGMTQGQIDRRNIRDVFKKTGMMDEGGNFQFQDGGTYATEKGTKDEWKIDAQAGDNGRAIGQMNALAALISGKGDGTELKDVTAGYLANAVTQAGGDLRQNSRELYNKMGFQDAGSAMSAVDDLLKKGVITEDVVDAYKNGIRDVFGAGGGSKSTGGERGKSSQGKAKAKTNVKEFTGNPLATPIPAITDWTTPTPNIASPVGGAPFTYNDYVNGYRRIAQQNNPLSRRL